MSVVALAEWLRRVPAKYMGSPRESSNLSGDATGSNPFSIYGPSLFVKILFIINSTFTTFSKFIIYVYIVEALLAITYLFPPLCQQMLHFSFCFYRWVPMMQHVSVNVINAKLVHGWTIRCKCSVGLSTRLETQYDKVGSIFQQLYEVTPNVVFCCVSLRVGTK